MSDTVFLEPKDDPRDRVEVEIGDSKQPEFLPQTKVLRWDNEANVSMRWQYTENQLDVVQQNGEVSFIGTKTEAHFYQLPESELFPEGAAESEIVLLEKPDTDKIIFTLRDKDVEYLHQPELTSEEIEAGAFRPEHIIDSYAIYTASQKRNVVGGKVYRTGKLGHLYRPRIEDAKGNWVWGGHAIKDSLRIVTIPEDFLRNAVYPIRHAAGNTFGYTTTPGTGQVVANNYAISSLGTAPASANVTSVSLYGSTGSSASLKPVVWLDSTKAVITDGVGNALSMSASADWNTATFGTNPAVSSSTAYQIGCVFNAGAAIYYDSGSSNDGGLALSNSYASPSTISWFFNSRRHGAYATDDIAPAGQPTILRFGGVPGMRVGQSFGRSW